MIEGYRQCVRSLLSIPLDEFEDGDPRPRRLPLSAAARAVYVAFVNEFGRRADDATRADVRAVLGKIEGVAVRLALVHQLASEEADPAGITEVGIEAMEAGIKLAGWFANEVIRVYGMIEESPDQQDQRELIELIRRRGGNLTIRDLQRSYQKKYKTADHARAALESLVGSGLGVWGDKGAFRLRVTEGDRVTIRLNN